MQQRQEAISRMEDQRDDFNTMQLLVTDQADAKMEMVSQVQTMQEQLQLSTEKHDAAVRPFSCCDGYLTVTASEWQLMQLIPSRLLREWLRADGAIAG